MPSVRWLGIRISVSVGMTSLFSWEGTSSYWMTTRGCRRHVIIIYATNIITVYVVQQIQHTAVVTQHNKSKALYLQLLYLSAVFQSCINSRFWHMHNQVYERDAYEVQDIHCTWRVQRQLRSSSCRNDKTCIVRSPLVSRWNATTKSAQASVKPGVGQSSETGTLARQSNTVCELSIFEIYDETNHTL